MVVVVGNCHSFAPFNYFRYNLRLRLYNFLVVLFLLVSSSSFTAQKGSLLFPPLVVASNVYSSAVPLLSSFSSTDTLSAFAIHHRRSTALMSTELKYKSLEDYTGDNKRFQQNKNFNNSERAGRTESNQQQQQQQDNYYISSSFANSSSYNPGLYYDTEWQENNIRRLSTVSNTIFLSAGIMYLVTSGWDINPPIEDDSSRAYMIYTLLGNLAPVTYLINSFFDIHIANCIKKDQQIKRRNRRLSLRTSPSNDDYITTMPHNNNNNNNNNNYNNYSSRDEKLLAGMEKWDDDDTNSMSNVTPVTCNNQNKSILVDTETGSSTSFSKSSLKRVRKFAAHRREFTAAFTFFIAALFSVLPVAIPLTIGITDEDAFTIFEGISIHTYMLSSIFALMGSVRALPRLDWNLGKADTLETLGDLLFFGGSMVDLILFDCHFDDGVVGWPIFSSTLWCVDAMLYLNSDWVASRMMKSREDVIV
eukprot:CAMPEP_0176496812 /NCGR_PEP_ID=MMETSP0200_2-20121128/11389_1 /TAXON_ID=947934 /ORGANISM="Chaetoceros sp., Strain GSL56" /LENGTH=475 /DNA_ID=CAMNT_0017894781 /DNA_START=358 /DNA_END=1785 /DNA_ORIENTATION=-